MMLGICIWSNVFIFFILSAGWNSEETEWDLCSGAALPVTGGTDTDIFMNVSDLNLCPTVRPSHLVF